MSPHAWSANRQQSAVPGAFTTSLQSTAKQPNGVPRLSAELVLHALDSLHTCSQHTADHSLKTTHATTRGCTSGAPFQQETLHVDASTGGFVAHAIGVLPPELLEVHVGLPLVIDPSVGRAQQLPPHHPPASAAGLGEQEEVCTAIEWEREYIWVMA
jgi:hypothetical protein